MRFAGAAALTLVATSAHAGTPPGFADEIRRALKEGPRGVPKNRVLLQDPRLRVSVTERFLWVEDLDLSLPLAPWMSPAPFTEAFDIARRAWFDSGQPVDVKALAVFVSFDVGAQNPFYLAMANDVRGIGQRIFDDTPESDVDGFIWMGNLEELWRAGPDFYREAFIHEVAHRWGVYVDVDHPGLATDALRGRQDQHWSFLADTDTSPMDGNDWLFSGNEATTIYSVPHEPSFSPLDLYLMGLVPPDAVEPWSVITAFEDKTPDWVNVSPLTIPAHRLDVTVTLTGAVRETVEIADVLSAEGPRAPSVGPTTWPIGIVLISSGFTGRASAADRARFDATLKDVVGTYGQATGGRMVLRATTVGGGIRGKGEDCAQDGDCDLARTDGCQPEVNVCAVRCEGDEVCSIGEACCDAWCQPASVCTPDRPDAGVQPDAAAPADAGPIARRPESSSCQSATGASTAPIGVLFASALLRRRRPTLSRSRRAR